MRSHVIFFLILSSFFGSAHADSFANFVAKTQKLLFEKSEGEVRALTITCKDYEHAAVIVGKTSRNNKSKIACTGSDGKKYKVVFYSVGASLIHVCTEDIKVKILSIFPITPKGRWTGPGGAFAFGGSAEGLVLVGKKGSFALAGGIGCGIGVDVSMSLIKIKPYGVEK